MGEAFCLRLMQGDGMNDNLSGNPAMPLPTGTTVQDREGITDMHPSAPSQQERKSHTATPMPASKNNRYRQTAVKAALAIFLLYKGLSMISPDRTPPQAAWRHERR